MIERDGLAMYQVPVPPVEDQEFIDDFLEFGIAHYFTAAKLLVGINHKLTDAEIRSIGLEVTLVASTAFELYITWYLALRTWREEANSKNLVDLLYQIRLTDPKRIGVFHEVQASSTEQFAELFRLPFSYDAFKALRLIPDRYVLAIDSARKNAEMILMNLAPEQLQQPGSQVESAWMIHLMNKIKHGLLVVTSTFEDAPVVRILTQGSDYRPRDGVPTVFTVGTRPEDLQSLLRVIGNITVALYQLITVVYTAAFGLQPTSFVMDEINKYVTAYAQPNPGA